MHEQNLFPMLCHIAHAAVTSCLIQIPNCYISYSTEIREIQHARCNRFTFGGLNGYVSGILISSSKLPPSYGVSAGPPIFPRNSVKLSLTSSTSMRHFATWNKNRVLKFIPMVCYDPGLLGSNPLVPQWRGVRKFGPEFSKNYNHSPLSQCVNKLHPLKYCLFSRPCRY